jgi:succinyl-diaminopimelate desuccinylase
MNTMELDEQVRKVLDEIDPEELAELTASLVRINTVWDPDAGTSEQPAAELAAGWAEKKGFQVEMDQVAPGRPNTIVTWDAGPGPRTLLFEGHTDVVTPGDPAAWQHDPFGAEIVGRRMYGRGTNDTKGNLAAMLIAMAALKRSAVPLAGCIVGGVLCDEEDAMIGVLDFIERGRADRVTGGVICEPQDGLICTSQKGAIRARYALEARMSHGAMPLSGLNCAPALSRLIDGLHRMEGEAVEAFGRHEHLGWPSMTPTVIQAPSAGAPQLNVMPGEAVLLVDVRTIPGQSHDGIREDLATLALQVEREVREHYEAYDRRLAVERRHDLKVEVSFITDRPCTRTDEQDPIVLAADWATRRISGKEPVHAGVPGATDGTFLWQRRHIPIVTMGAGVRDVAHQADEWVDLDQLTETARIYALSALHYLRPGASDA